MVIWITGLSGSGKTTICDAIRDLVISQSVRPIILDGDIVREAFGNDLTHREEHRQIQISRLQRLAKALSDQGHLILVAALYASDELLAWNRNNIENYFEVYLDAPLSLVRKRDPKGLYAKADAGDMPDVVGIDIPWTPPKNPDLTVDFESAKTPQHIARKIVECVLALNKHADMGCLDGLRGAL
jgi:cytidine diphosphoramidate kinase